jgi:DNA-binding CsgD family transcriptional regulator
MHFRDATPADIPQILDSLGTPNALPCSDRLRHALPGLLPRLIASPACLLVAFEGEVPPTGHVFSWGGSLLVRAAVIDTYLAAPRPALAAQILESLLDGAQPLLTFDEIRQANSGDGLQLVLVALPMGRLPWTHPAIDLLRRLAPLAFMQSIAGYRVASIYYEVFTDEVAVYVQHGGYRLLHDFSQSAGSGFIGPNARPRMLRLERGDLPPGAMSFATQLFMPPPPRLRLTPAEQRIALKALGGLADHAIADAFGISPETVRSHWSSIYGRLSAALPEFTDQDSSARKARGPERRRSAVEYLRQHMQELRPHL